MAVIALVRVRGHPSLTDTLAQMAGSMCPLLLCLHVGLAAPKCPLAGQRVWLVPSGLLLTKASQVTLVAPG